MPEKPDKLPDVKKMKVILAGEGGAGKTSVAKRFVEDSFSKGYEATIGSDFRVRTVNIGTLEVRINLWDLSGHPEFFEVRN